MRTIPALLAATLLFSSAACIFVVNDDGTDVHGFWSRPEHRGSGTLARETRTLPPFTRIEVGGSFDVEVKVGPAQDVAVACDDNLLGRVRTEVRDGALHIGLERGSHEFRHGPRIEVVLPELRGLAVSGSANVRVEGLSGGDLSLSVAGSGDVRAGGRVDALSASVAGSGDLHLYELSARSARVSVAGSGSAEVQALEDFAANVAGSGDVRYRGKPARVESHVSGSGSIQPAG